MPIALMVSIWQPKAYIADLLAMPDAADIEFDPQPQVLSCLTHGLTPNHRRHDGLAARPFPDHPELR